jgi:CheY-like chemotaxis protein
MVDTDILLVDDEQDSCASMSDIFLDLGYTVDLAYEGPGALELSGWHQYRLALLDYKMPGHGRHGTLPALEKLPA